MGLLYVCGLSCLRDHLSPGAGSFVQGGAWLCNVSDVLRTPPHFTFPCAPHLKYHAFEVNAMNGVLTDPKHVAILFSLWFINNHTALCGSCRWADKVPRALASTSCGGWNSGTGSLHTRCTHISMMLQKYFCTSWKQWAFQENLGMVGILTGMA